MTSKPRLGKLPPMYHFVLNPHAETRVSTCPQCEKKMRQRKVPLFVHVGLVVPVILGYTCRYCPDCDLLVAHQDEIEHLLAGILAERAPDVIGNDYLVLGTVERAFWRESMKTPKGPAEMLDYLHDFEEIWSLEFDPGGWYRDEEGVAVEREIAQARAGFAASRGYAPLTDRLQEERKKERPAPRRKKRRKKSR